MSIVNCKVQNIRPQYNNLKEWIEDDRNVYIGRAGIVYIEFEGKKFRFPRQASTFCNPYKIGIDGTRIEVIKKYQKYLETRLVNENDLCSELMKLKGKNLGCWCAPEPCHGDILLKLIKEKEQEKKEIHSTDAITITFGDQAENHAGMQQIGKMQNNGFTVEELENIKKLTEKNGLICELINLNTALPEEFKESSEKAYVLIIRGLLNSFGMSADKLFHELKTVKWDTFLVSTRTNEIQLKHARANICISDAKDIPLYTKEDIDLHKDSDYWQYENLSVLYGKQQDMRTKLGVRIKLSKQEIQSNRGTIIKWETLSVLQKFKKYIEENFGKHANNLVAEGNSYYDLKKCYIGPHGDTERKIVIAIRLGRPFPMYFHWYHKSKPIGDLITLPVLNHGDIYIMSEKAVGQDWKSPNKITLRHSAGCIDNKTEFKK